MEFRENTRQKGITFITRQDKARTEWKGGTRWHKWGLADYKRKHNKSKWANNRGKERCTKWRLVWSRLQRCHSWEKQDTKQSGTRQRKEEYERKRKVATKLCRSKKKKMIRNKLIELENHNMKRNIWKFYKDMEQLNRDYRLYINNCKDRNGNLLIEQD